MAEQIKTSADLVIIDRAAGWSVTANEHGLAVNVMAPLDRTQSHDLTNAIHTAVSRLPAPPLPPMPQGFDSVRVNTHNEPF